MEVLYLVSPELSNEALNALFDQAWVGHGKTNYSYLKNHSLGWIGGFDGAVLVGFVNVAWDGNSHAFLLDTTVHPGYQRCGIGTALVERALTMARERGVEWVHVDFEPELEGFYRGCGFRGTAAGVLSF